jgi:hypothetical protein
MPENSSLKSASAAPAAWRPPASWSTVKQSIAGASICGSGLVSAADQKAALVAKIKRGLDEKALAAAKRPAAVRTVSKSQGSAPRSPRRVEPPQKEVEEINGQQTKKGGTMSPTEPAGGMIRI